MQSGTPETIRPNQTPMNEITIRMLETIRDFKDCEDIQKEVWGFSEREIVPLAELKSTLKAGGLAAGAFDREGTMAGFVLGFWALDESGKVFHYSRRLGVRKSLRGLGLGRTLKLYQKDFVLGRGFSLVRWTYDPLEGENASLNIGKLGAEASDYLVDFYGTDPEPPNRGIPTDRFFVRWQVDSDRVRERAESGRPDADPAELLATLPCMLKSRPLAGGLSAVGETAAIPGGSPVTAEIPASMRALKEADLKEALRWRTAFRGAAMSLFSKGYRAVEFATGEVEGRRRSLYVFSKGGK